MRVSAKENWDQKANPDKVICEIPFSRDVQLEGCLFK